MYHRRMEHMNLSWWSQLSRMVLVVGVLVDCWTMTGAWTRTYPTHPRRKPNLPITSVTSTASTGSTTPKGQRSRMLQPLPMSSIFFGPPIEEECPSEEECEINWDLMPDWEEETNTNTNTKTNHDDDNTNQNGEPSTPATTQASDMGTTSTTEMMNSSVARHQAQKQPTSPQTRAEQLQEMRGFQVRLEMNWQMDECEIHPLDSCQDFCMECAGSGKQPCHFCHGTTLLTLGNNVANCRLCKSGKIDCAACRGTGFIAPWATTMNHHLNASK